MPPPGRYSYQDVEIFVAWGYRDERHCRFHAFWDCGDWGHPSRAALGYAPGLAGAWSAYREGDRESVV